VGAGKRWRRVMLAKKYTARSGTCGYKKENYDNADSSIAIITIGLKL
jgi:hypothetical protein